MGLFWPLRRPSIWLSVLYSQSFTSWHGSLALESRGWACEPLPPQISTNCSLVAFLGFDRREAQGNEYVMISIYLLGTDCWKCSSLRGFTHYLPSTNCQSAANCMALICGNEKHHSKKTITYRQTESFVGRHRLTTVPHQVPNWRWDHLSNLWCSGFIGNFLWKTNQWT